MTTLFGEPNGDDNGQPVRLDSLGVFEPARRLGAHDVEAKLDNVAIASLAVGELFQRLHACNNPDDARSSAEHRFAEASLGATHVPMVTRRSAEGKRFLHGDHFSFADDAKR